MQEDRRISGRARIVAETGEGEFVTIGNAHGRSPATPDSPSPVYAATLGVLFPTQDCFNVGSPPFHQGAPININED